MAFRLAGAGVGVAGIPAADAVRWNRGCTAQEKDAFVCTDASPRSGCTRRPGTKRAVAADGVARRGAGARLHLAPANVGALVSHPGRICRTAPLRTIAGGGWCCAS
ncbi:hypothetical protein [Ferroacidibacillus organovorans]|uniref:hypothetical protein n=1 Tax=Ferroacidibacillus organovorans TaxID=1765683 RepID=UPI0012E8BC97|nr:hypothetical protein [Ferroacidibacillus organovorans]